MPWKASAHGYGQPREAVDQAVMCDAVAHMIFGNAGLNHARDLNRPRRRERVQVHAGRSGRREDHLIANSDLNRRRTGGSERALSVPCARARTSSTCAIRWPQRYRYAYLPPKPWANRRSEHWPQCGRARTRTHRVRLRVGAQ